MRVVEEEHTKMKPLLESYKRELELYKKNQLLGTDIEIRKCKDYCAEFDKILSPDDRMFQELQSENAELKGQLRSLSKENINLRKNLEVLQERYRTGLTQLLAHETT